MQYDAVGNLFDDPSRQLRLMRYDYRNLLAGLYAAPTVGSSSSRLDFTYDETGQRISKVFKFRYTAPCGNDTAIAEIQIPEGFNAPSGETTLGTGGVETFYGPPGGGTCYFWDYDKKYYLYDNGVLVCTFDEDDNVEEMFVNGPNGKLAVYDNNLNANLYYFLNDRLGSSRGTMAANTGGTPQLTQYTNYHPYGLVSEQAGSYLTDFQYTGKEHDQHSSFDFQYYGARYYDPAHGIFTSVDAAGEFASGYVYCGGNPISLVDPDGNSVGGAIWLGLKIFGAFQAVKATLNLVDAWQSGQIDGAEFFLSFVLQNAQAFTTLAVGPDGAGVMSLMPDILTDDPLKGWGRKLGMNLAITELMIAAHAIDYHFGIGKSLESSPGTSQNTPVYDDLVPVLDSDGNPMMLAAEGPNAFLIIMENLRIRAEALAESLAKGFRQYLKDALQAAGGAPYASETPSGHSILPLIVEHDNEVSIMYIDYSNTTGYYETYRVGFVGGYAYGVFFQTVVTAPIGAASSTSWTTMAGRYPSGGRGFNIYYRGTRVLGLDYHAYPLGGRVVTGIQKAHLDSKLFGWKHQPWKWVYKTFGK